MKKRIILLLVLFVLLPYCTVSGMLHGSAANTVVLQAAMEAFIKKGYEVKQLDDEMYGVFGSFEQGHEAMLGKVGEVVQSVQFPNSYFGDFVCSGGFGNIIVIPNEPGDGSVRYRNLPLSDDVSWIKTRKKIVFEGQFGSNVANCLLCIYNVHSDLQFRNDMSVKDKLALEFPLNYFITGNNDFPVIVVVDVDSAACPTLPDKRVDLLVKLKKKKITLNECVKEFEGLHQLNNNDSGQPLELHISVWEKLKNNVPLAAFLIILTIVAYHSMIKNLF